MHKKFYSNNWFLKKDRIFSIFPIEKKAANYAEISRVSKLGADFPFV